MTDAPDKRVVEIATSFSKKISLSNYGGPQYESEDIFVSMKEEVDVTPSTDQTSADKIAAYTKGASKFLQNQAEELLAERIKTLVKRRL